MSVSTRASNRDADLRIRASDSSRDVTMVEVGVGITPDDLGWTMGDGRGDRTMGESERGGMGIRGRMGEGMRLSEGERLGMGDSLLDTTFNSNKNFSPLNHSTHTPASADLNTTSSSFHRIAELEHHVQGLEASLLQVDESLPFACPHPPPNPILNPSPFSSFLYSPSQSSAYSLF